MSTITELFSTHGILIIFIVITMEHMNLPGLPAGAIMPGIGLLVAQGKLSLIKAIIVCLIAGIVGSSVLYIIGYIGGEKLLDEVGRRFPKIKPSINRARECVNNNSKIKMVICRFIPVVRTLIALVEGGMRINFVKFLIGSSLGISIFNGVLIIAGYLTGLAII